jgi:hypothetical protein
MIANIPGVGRSILAGGRPPPRFSAFREFTFQDSINYEYESTHSGWFVTAEWIMTHTGQARTYHYLGPTDEATAFAAYYSTQYDPPFILTPGVNYNGMVRPNLDYIVAS